MAKLGKRTKKAQEGIDRDAFYNVDEAVKLVKEHATAKFDETVEFSINLNVDPRHADQMVRGTVNLPNGTGKNIRVAVFAQGANADAAKEAGADVVGMDDLAETIKGGDLNFDVVIASPDAMGVVGKLGQILGPRGLMPNPKVGTVSPDVGGAVTNAKSGQVRYRVDKAGIIHCSIGSIDFSADKLIGNLQALLVDLNKKKPSAAKGVYIKKITASTTMGPGLVLDQSSLESSTS
mgnify:CR=1 FL=1